MEFDAVNTLTLQFSDSEIESLLTLIDKLYKTPKRVGFKKEISNVERLLIEDMYKKLLEGNEEDIDQD